MKLKYLLTIFMTLMVVGISVKQALADPTTNSPTFTDTGGNLRMEQNAQGGNATQPRQNVQTYPANSMPANAPLPGTTPPVPAPTSAPGSKVLPGEVPPNSLPKAAPSGPLPGATSVIAPPNPIPPSNPTPAASQ